MGVVFKARHIFLKTAHAIKIILPDLVGNDPNLVTRFRQEALAAAAIRHQNIIAVTDFGVVRGTMPFLVMEFVQGKSLQDLMAEEGAMPPLRAFELMHPICAGIAAAHRQGIVHRDLKPLNVMICDDMPIAEAVKILDFGLAKIKSGELLGSFIAAQTTGLMGSPFYMAPEQWSDEPPDARADVYSLGVMLYQMLCGEVPFKGSSIPSIMKKHLTSDVPSFESRGFDIPLEIENIVRHALEKEPADRTPSADDFARELWTQWRQRKQLKRTADSAEPPDPSKTIVGPPPSIASPGSTTADPMAERSARPRSKRKTTRHSLRNANWRARRRPARDSNGKKRRG
jgi:serine/threonine-protein kinase